MIKLKQTDNNRTGGILIFKFYTMNQLKLPLDLEKIHENDIDFAVNVIVESIPDKPFSLMEPRLKRIQKNHH